MNKEVLARVAQLERAHSAAGSTAAEASDEGGRYKNVLIFGGPRDLRRQDILQQLQQGIRPAKPLPSCASVGGEAKPNRI